MPLQAATRLLQMPAIAKPATHSSCKLHPNFREELSHKLRLSRQFRTIEPRRVRQEPAGWQIVQFDVAGTISGHAGCNRFTGSYGLEGANISIESLAMTRMACPTEIMSIEINFVEALQGATRMAIADQRMALRTDDGATLARFDAVSRSE